MLCTMSPKFVCVTIDTCSSFIYALALSGEKAINPIKPLNSAVVVMWVPWALKPKRNQRKDTGEREADSHTPKSKEEVARCEELTKKNHWMH